MSVRRDTITPSTANCPLVLCQSQFNRVLSVGGKKPDGRVNVNKAIIDGMHGVKTSNPSKSNLEETRRAENARREKEAKESWPAGDKRMQAVWWLGDQIDEARKEEREAELEAVVEAAQEKTRTCGRDKNKAIKAATKAEQKEAAAKVYFDCVVKQPQLCIIEFEEYPPVQTMFEYKKHYSQQVEYLGKTWIQTTYKYVVIYPEGGLKIDDNVKSISFPALGLRHFWFNVDGVKSEHIERSKPRWPDKENEEGPYHNDEYLFFLSERKLPKSAEDRTKLTGYDPIFWTWSSDLWYVAVDLNVTLDPETVKSRLEHPADEDDDMKGHDEPVYDGSVETFQMSISTRVLHNDPLVN
jgi:hypothetical protein